MEQKCGWLMKTVLLVKFCQLQSISDIDSCLHFDFAIYRKLYSGSFLPQYFKLLPPLPSVCLVLLILVYVFPATEGAHLLDFPTLLSFVVPRGLWA